MSVSLPPGVNQVKIPSRCDSKKDVPFGAGRPVNIAQTSKTYLAKSEVARSSEGGRPPAYETPEILRHSCDEYFQWCDDNPLLERVTNFAAKTGRYYASDVPRRRPYTQGALCLYLGICRMTWHNLGKKEEFKAVVDEVNAEIYEQKFAGATVGFFNANIIARDLGLVDKQEVTDPNGGGPILKITATMTPAEAAELYAKTRES